MARKWTYSKATTLGGRIQLVISKLTPGGRTVDVTMVRGAATQIGGYSDADPFGDSTATFSFPALTPFDDLQAADLVGWLDYYSNVDLYWVPAIPADARYAGYEGPVINALTNQPDVITPSMLRDADGAVLADNRIKLWEGFIASMDFSADATSAGLEIQCQGALFQLDRYLQKPFFPAVPWPLETLITDAFDHVRKPHLRTQALKILWPSGWKLVVPAYSKRNVYTPVGTPGSKWVGYTSRQTGSWDHALTGFVQDQLSVMITDGRSGVTPGNQWTVNHVHQSVSGPGRAPVLQVRDRFRTPDFTLWVGTPGVSVHLSGDSTQSENIIYGDGTGLDGSGWRNAVIANDGSRTDYLPLAAAREVFPERNNPAFQLGSFASEAYTKYSTGFDQPAATSIAEQSLARDRQPGWTGTITVSTDPSVLMSRWMIRAGMTVLLKGFAGSGETGIPFHISAKTANPMDGTVELTVDTRYRDLLTVDEAIARTRDPLNPVKMLQVNKSSVMIEDIQAPWDYSAGSGFIPTKSQAFFDYKPSTDVFPYTDWSQKHSPKDNPSWYVKVNAAAPTTQGRWSLCVPFLTSEKDTISRTEFYMCDFYGRPVKAPFHVSIYYVNITYTSMPHLNGNYSPFQNNAFETVDPNTGVQVHPMLGPSDKLIIGWGSQAGGVMNRAGFWPGRESGGASPTGLMVDDAAWQFDNTIWNQYFKANNPPGKRVLASYISLYAMFYCDYKEPVYFMGRLFRQNPGTS